MMYRTTNPYQENVFIKREPSWVTRWGIILVTVFFLLLIGLSGVISFPDVIHTEVVITTKAPLVKIKVKQNGRLKLIQHQSGDTVPKGAVLGVIETTGNFGDIQNLKHILDTILPDINNLEELDWMFPSTLVLGTGIQPFYNRFLTAYHQFILGKALDDDNIRKDELQYLWASQGLGIKNKEATLKTQQRNLDLAKTKHKRYQSLYEKGVVSLQQLEQVETDFLELKQNFQNAALELHDLKQRRSATKFNQQLGNNETLKNKSVRYSEWLLSKQTLQTGIMQWEDDYVLKSPTNGRVSYFELWSQYQNVKEGNVIFTILPLGHQELIGKSDIPAQNSGKLKAGQRAIIKLENYPYREWGTLEGKVQTIAEIPNQEGGYRVYINIARLTTSYQRQLEFKQDMHGSAEIILEDLTLLQRIFYQFKSLWYHA